MTTFLYAGVYSDSVTGAGTGRALANTAVSVCIAGTRTLAVLYTDASKGLTAPNPVVTDASGNLEFHADPGDYDCYPAGGGRFFAPVLPNPNEFSTQAVVTAAIAAATTTAESVAAGVASGLVGAEQTRATNAESALNTALTTEASNRSTGDTNAIAAAATAAAAAIASAIASEASSRATGDTNAVAAAATASATAIATQHAADNALYGQSIRSVRQADWLPCATRNNTGYLGLFGLSSSQTFFTKHFFPVDTFGLKLGYGNSYGTSGGPQGDGPGNLTVGCSVQPVAGGPIFLGYFGGAHTGVITPGAVLENDGEIPCFIKGGTWALIATFVSGNWPIGLAVNTARGYGQSNTFDPSETNDSGEGIANPSATDTTTTFAKTSSTQTAYSPLYILGRIRTPIPRWLITGDSIIHYSVELPDMGWATRALNNQWPVTKMSQPGETAQQWAVNGTAGSLVAARQRLLGLHTHHFHGHGRNDVAGRTLAQVQADLITDWSRDAAAGLVGFQPTITPKVTTSDQYATLIGQTTDASNAVRLTLNAYLRDGAPMIGSVPQAVGATGGTVARCNVYDKTGTLVTAASGPAHYLAGGVLEVADVVESARDSGKFNVLNVRTVADAAMSTGATPKQLTSATANFVAADVGKSVFVTGAGSAGAVLATTITAVTNSTTVTLFGSCSTTVTNAALQIGAATYDGTHMDGYWHRQVAAAVKVVSDAASAAYLSIAA